MEIILEHITKAYDGREILSDLCLTLKGPDRFCLMGASGLGKTTLLRLLLGLEKPSAGVIRGLERLRVTAVFQEDRLCEAFSPLENVTMAAGRSLPKEEARKALAEILPEECLNRPVSTLSGGMKRRTAICRALLAPSDVVIMDEPFTGLDEGTKAEVIAFVKKRTEGKLLLSATHQEEDIELLDAKLIRLDALL